MSMPRFVLMLLAAATIGLSGARVHAQPVWSIDFENGFTASSGTPVIVGGSTGDAYNTANMVHLRTHSSRPGNYEARIGSGLDPASLRYEGLDPAVLGSSGSVTFALRIGVAGYPDSMANFIAADGGVGSPNYWYVGMSKPYRFIVRTHSYAGVTPWERQYIYDIPGPLSVGWHTLTFSWQETVAQTGSTRQQADIALTIDGEPAFSDSNVLWSPPGQTCLGLGSRRTASGTFYPLGNEYIMLDNVEITSGVAPPQCGDPGTVYLDADFNRDCHVNFVDLSFLGRQWMTCTELNDADCAGFLTHEPILLDADEHVVTYGQPLTIDFVAPYGQQNVYLSLDGKQQWPASHGQVKGASAPIVRYRINGQAISDPDALMNLPDARDVLTPSGTRTSWTGGVNVWRLPNNNVDWAPLESVSLPIMWGDWPYTSVFDITDFVNPGQINQIEIAHVWTAYPDNTLAVKNIQLLFEYDRPDPDPRYDDIPDLQGQPVVPQTDFTVPFTATLTSGGGIQIGVGPDQYDVHSKFSYPNGTFNRLRADGTAQGEWSVSVAGNQLTATGSLYRLDRTIITHPDRVEVQDTVTNLSGSVVPIRFGHELEIATADLENAYIHGLRVPTKLSSTDLSIRATGHPSVYVCKAESGIGLLACDDVFRCQIGLLMQDGSYGIHDRHFALDTGASYTFRWDIYPTARAEYYDFANAARRSLGANFLIDGNFAFAHGHTGNMADVTDEEILTLVNANNLKYVAILINRRVDQAGEIVNDMSVDAYAHGTGFVTSHGDWSRYWFEQIVARYRSLVPDVKLVPYIDAFLTAEPDALTTYPDSYPTRSGGAPHMYKEDSYGIYVMTPRWDNSYGPALDVSFDYLKQQSDGYYLDESTAHDDLVAGPWSYRSDTWDGRSCQINLGSGGWDETGATYALTRKRTLLSLYTLDYRAGQIQDALDAGKSVWCNFAPGSETETVQPVPRFIETTINNNAVYAHLTSPLGLGNVYWELDETDLGRSMRYRLTYGGLLIAYGKKYQTDGNIMQDTYPIHPVELHCGYVIGQNKIITCVSGEYGFGDASNLDVKFYDPGGFRIPERTAVISYDAVLQSNLADVQLNDGEMAIIFRQP